MDIEALDVEKDTLNVTFSRDPDIQNEKTVGTDSLMETTMKQKGSMNVTDSLL